MPKRLQVYETPEITVTFDPNRCIHSGVCVRGLPEVFDVTRKRWVRPELASAQRRRGSGRPLSLRRAAVSMAPRLGWARKPDTRWRVSRPHGRKRPAPSPASSQARTGSGPGSPGITPPLPELLVGFYKRDSGKPSITWPESVDQALCFGWIDGVRRRLDEVSYTIRFTPRRTGSNWSAINIRRVEALQAEGLMHPAGLTAFAKRSDDKSRIYSYEQRHTAKLDPEHQKKLEGNRKAWAFFQAQPPGYQRLMTFWVVSAKKEETRLKRLQRLIDESAKGRRLL